MLQNIYSCKHMRTTPYHVLYQYIKFLSEFNQTCSKVIQAKGKCLESTVFGVF